MIQINELPFIHIVIALDRREIPKQGWTGPFGKLKVHMMEIYHEFPAFPELIDIFSFVFPEKIV